MTNIAVQTAAIAVCGTCPGRLAVTVVHRRLRLFDLTHIVRAALIARLLSHPDVVCQPLGPRRVRVRAGAAESPLGRRSAAGRHHCRPVRRCPRIVRWRPDVCGGACADGACDRRSGARSVGRPADRFWPLWHVIYDDFGDVRQAGAAALALARLRPRHGGRILWAVSLFAALGRAHRLVRLATRG